jgi:hypothetical protein
VTGLYLALLLAPDGTLRRVIEISPAFPLHPAPGAPLQEAVWARSAAQTRLLWERLSGEGAVFDFPLEEADGTTIRLAGHRIDGGYFLAAGSTRSELTEICREHSPAPGRTAAGAPNGLPRSVDELAFEGMTGLANDLSVLQRELARANAELRERNGELERALARMHDLEGLLPVCSYCRRIKDESEGWLTLESYLAAHSRVEVSHGICPDCFETHVRPTLDEPSRG